MNEKYNNFPWCLERGTSRIFELEDKAEILRWFAQEEIPRQQKEDFISALIDFEDGCGGFYSYRAYFLAAEALAYFPDCRRGDEIVRQLLRWSYAYFQEKPNWEKVPISLVRAAQATLEKTDRKRVVAAFVEKVHTTESKFVLRHAAERLGKLDPGNPLAVSTLVCLIKGCNPIELLQRSAYPLIDYHHDLATIGASERVTVDKIIECFQTFLLNKNSLFDDLVYWKLLLLNFSEMLTQSQLKMSKSSLLKLTRFLVSHLRKPCGKNSPDRYDASYQIVWYCANKMSYPEFYNIWQE